ncbi:MAG: hypothetical protein KIS67_25530 [Verrucomicrobiae bacterium]|nr:hypothetical protein [Verrucomicrobiae bacterium]
MKKAWILTSFTALAIGSLGLTGCSNSEHGHDHAKSDDHAGHAHADATTTTSTPYPLDKCIVSDEGFNHGDPYVFVHEGQEIKLCCKSCLPDFEKEPAKFMAKLNHPK